MGPVASASNFVLSVSGGAAWLRAGETQTFFLQPDVEKTYVAIKKTNSVATGEVFFGWQKPVTDVLLSQIGLAVGATGNAKLQGDILEDADPAFNNFYYGYKVKQTRVSLKAKLIADMNYWVQPYISGSAGIGFNRANDYYSVAKIIEEVPAPSFTAHTTDAFTYNLGAGLQAPIGAHLRAGVGYEFADFGKNQLGRAPGQTRSSGIKLSHLYTNSVLLSLSYII